MATYITKKSDKGGSKAKEKYIAESNQPKEKKKIEYIKKKIHYIKKKVKQADLTEHRADIEKAVSEGVGYRDNKWITRKNSKTNPARPHGGWKN